MSKEGSAAQDLKIAEAANAQESEVRNLKPVEGSPEAEAVLGEREAVSEVMKLPLFEEALAAIEAVEKGDNKALDQLSHSYGSKNVKFLKRMPFGPNGGSGWHCSAQEKGPLAVEQSQQLADLINSKIDVEKMNADAEAAGAARRKRKVRKQEGKEGQEAEKAKESEPEAGTKVEISSFELEKLIGIVEGAEDMRALTNFVHDAKVHDAKRAGLIKMSGGRKWEVSAVEDLEGSAQLVQAINSKKKKLLKDIYRTRAQEQRKKEKLQRKLAGLERSMNEKEDLSGLEKLAYQFLDRKLGVIKKVSLPGKGNWTVEAVEGKEGSEEVVKMVLARKAVLEVREKTAQLIQKHS